MNVEEENTQKKTPKGCDSSRKAGPSNADYVVDDTEKLGQVEKGDASTEISWRLCMSHIPPERQN